MLAGVRWTRFTSTCSCLHKTNRTSQHPTLIPEVETTTLPTLDHWRRSAPVVAMIGYPCVLGLPP